MSRVPTVNAPSRIDLLFQGGGEMGSLMRAKDWRQTAVGPPEIWPHSLRTAVRIILLARYPMFVWWGKELVNLYNDQYMTILGKKHPASLGTSARESWKEIWYAIGPRVEAVMERGEATFDEALLLMMDRHGYLEETYFTFSYSPLPNDAGNIGGLFCAVTEETERVINERRMALLRKVATATANARTEETVCLRASECLSEANLDLPFALIYLREPGGATLRRVCLSGISMNHAAAPARLDLESAGPWPVISMQGSGSPTIVGDLSSRFPELPAGGWKTPPHQAMLVPLAQQGQAEPAGLLVAGLNPHRRVDDAFSGWVGLIANQIAAGLANANAYVAERKRAEALAELDKAKTTFFSNVSHEFRTPLTLMLGPTEDALASQEHALTGEELERVHRNQLRLLKLVNALLDFSRIETGRIKARYQPTDLAIFTAELASVFRSAMTRAGLSFKVKTPRLPQPVYVDRDMWEKIVLNLLSNALKSTFEGGITVELRDATDHIEVSVKDTGTGIPEAEIPHLFERFRRIENARMRTHEGSGIGLALVDELVRMHGGSISVRSKVDHGSVFTVSLPYGTAHLSCEAIVPESTTLTPGAARSAYIQEALSWLPGNQEESTELTIFHTEQTAYSPSGNQSTGRVLLVDDNRDMREYVQRLLGGTFEVSTAENGRVALEMALRNPPDIIVSDVMMPEMDGYQLLAELRKTEATATVPVILLSARAGEESRVEGMQAGADDYLTKPFTARELLARVQAHLKIARFRQLALQRQMQLEVELQEARRQAAEAVENITDSLMALDFDWRFTYLNPRAKSLVRAAGAMGDVVGKTIWEAFPTLEGTEFAMQYRRCMTLRVPVQCESPFLDRWYAVRAYPSPTGIVIYAVDITSRKLVETELRMKQEHLLLTQKAVKIGTWELNVEDEYLTISPEFAEIAGLSPHVSRMKYTDFLQSLFLSGDRKKSEDGLRQALRSKKEFMTELRLRRPDGDVRLVSNRGKVFYNQGRPIVLGVLVDITSPEDGSSERPVRSPKVRTPRKKLKVKKSA